MIKIHVFPKETCEVYSQHFSPMQIHITAFSSPHALATLESNLLDLWESNSPVLTAGYLSFQDKLVLPVPAEMLCVW